MDFFERWFHFSPDGGDGTLEAAYLALLFVVVSATVFYLALRKSRHRDLPAYEVSKEGITGPPGPVSGLTSAGTSPTEPAP
jgi:hypothetical protein